MSHADESSAAQAVAEAPANYTAAMTIESAPAEVFEALTTRHGISGWWGPVKGDPRVGGEFTFRPMVNIEKLFHVDVAESDSLVEWKVLECEFLPEWPGTTIRFELSPEGDGATRLQFEHVGLSAQLECWNICEPGWNQSLASLKSYLDTGQGNPF
jgi:uncharacterized protein YndB with AHSA1/START domain